MVSSGDMISMQRYGAWRAIGIRDSDVRFWHA